MKRFSLLAVLFLLIAFHTAVSGEKKDKDLAAELVRIPPREPKDAIKSFTLAPGFRIELVACEPLIRSPVAIDFDEDGRLYVCEFPEYNLHDDPTFKEKGCIKRLEDTDGDGVFDKATVFAADVSAPTAVACWAGGVFVGSVPNILYMKDTDGDGKADVRSVVLTGFERDKAGEGMLNSFRWGLDNRFHLSTSSAGGLVRSAQKENAEAVNVRSRFILFEPRGRGFETVSAHGQHGMSMDDWGRAFVCDNSNPIHSIVYDGRYAARNPFAIAPPVAINIHDSAAAPKLARTSEFEPWRVARTRLRMAGAVKGPTEGGQVGGHFTGATGVTLYRGDAFPPECRGQAFIGEVSNNLVHRVNVTPKGLGFSATRADQGREFLASSDNWFRPCQFANGPDGCLYVVDMYRELIETVLSIPPEILKHLHPRSGVDRGRIWRIVPEKFERRPQPQLSKASVDGLIALLDHPNGWHRDTASRLLYERQDFRKAAALAAMAKSAKTPQGRVHALYALDGIDQLRLLDVLDALGDDNPRVREHALRLSEQFADRPAVVEKWSRMIDDGDERVRWQLAFSLGTSLSKPATEALVKLAPSSDDRLMRFAVMSSSAGRAGPLVEGLMANAAVRDRPSVRLLLLDLAESIGQSKREDDIAALLQSADSAGKPGRDLIAAMLVKLPAEMRNRLQSTSARAVLASMLDDARTTALDPKRPLPDRVAAARNLRLGAFAESRPLYGKLLHPSQPEDVQKATLDALSAASVVDAREAAILIVNAWPGMSPPVRATAVETLLSRPLFVSVFFDQLEKGAIKSSEIDPARALLIQKDPATSARAAKLFTALTKRGDVLAQYKAAADKPGDVDRGRTLFRKHCTACHRREGVGEQIGADLAGIQDRGAEFLLTNILDPNREVLPKFLAYQAETDAGRSIAGMIQGETATSITLRRLDGTSETILRAQLESLRSTGVSFMPEGFEKQLGVAEMADLIAYLLISPVAVNAPSREPGWKAGAAKVVITPERPMWMAGYGARNKPAEGKAGELYAKALMLEDAAGEKAVLVTLDLIGIDRDFSQKLTKAISSKFGLPRDRILLTVSHTHSGPVVGKTLNTMYFLDETQAKLVDEYTGRVHDLIVDAVAQSAKNLRPARLDSGRGHAGFAVNRRENKEKDVPALREAGRLKGPVSHEVPVLTIRDDNDALHAIVFGYACHATTVDGYDWSGDWPGFAQSELESAHPGAVAMFWAGCGADQNPIPRRSLTLARAYGKELAQSVEAVLKAPMNPVRPTFKARYQELSLPLAELPSREKLVDDTRDANKFIASRAKYLLNELSTRGELRATYPYPIQAWQLGDDVAWVALGGEVVVDYTLRLQKELGPVWCTAYANDVMAYIPSVRVLKEGGYEGASSMIYYGQPTVWSPRIEDMIVEAASRAVLDVRPKPR